ncbi:D-alanyl-D-alanine carboxypeptidase/D-alanyl-D-alanine-endopeptidase [Bergeyella sp. RCAD1439]|nr:D-alanyl-D-alanine carboxypeptidase/D-alanyl-D-alanine-endopeptidase [Bergeyella sp. RCAD1439]
MYENQAKASSSVKESEKYTLSTKDEIDININRLMSDPVLKNANWGFVIYDPKTQKVVSAYNENEAFVPASTTKLLTTDTALSLLGPKFRWITQLEYSGSLNPDGVLEGNLYIVGSGDPSLGTGKAGASNYTSLLADFVQEISAKGIKKITGDIIIQTAVFKENKRATLPENIVWMEHGSYYLPVGTTRNINPRNEKLTKKNNPFSDDKSYFYVSPYIHQLVYADKFEGEWVDTKLPDAPSYLATKLRESLIKKGIAVAGKVTPKMVDRDPETRTLITLYRSPLLSDIVYDTNQRSDNALSESLLRMVGFQKQGDQTLESGRAVVTENLKQKNFDTSALVYVDGSGLSRSHRVTPMAQARFLAGEMKESYYKDFFNSLPVAGQTGTLKKMFFGEGYGQIFAKTGTLNKVKTLAGYIKTRSGKTLTFSLLINNYAGSVDQVKKRMEELLEPAVNL